MDYVILKAGGKQYRVKPGDVIDIDKFPAEQGSVVELTDILACSRDGEVTLGQPLVPDASVLAQVQGQVRDDKIIVFKYKRKVRYRRKKGHRQPYTRLAITSITVDGKELRIPEVTARRDVPTGGESGVLVAEELVEEEQEQIVGEAEEELADVGEEPIVAEAKEEPADQGEEPIVAEAEEQPADQGEEPIVAEAEEQPADVGEEPIVAEAKEEPADQGEEPTLGEADAEIKNEAQTQPKDEQKDDGPKEEYPA